MEKLLTPQEIADTLKIKKTTVYEMLKRGEILSSKIGKQIRVREEDFQIYLAHRTPTVTQNLSPTATISSGNLLPDTPEYLKSESSILKQDYLKKLNGLILSGSNPAIDLLCAHIESEPDGLPILRSSQNSYNSLYALYFKKTHGACIALSDLAGQQNNESYIHHLMPGTQVIRIHLAKVMYGVYCRKIDIATANIASDILKDIFHGTPNVEVAANYIKSGISIINRELGSTSRILLDELLTYGIIIPEELAGYKKEVLSDLACATAVASGRADAAIGSTVILNQFPTLGILPLTAVDLEFVFEKMYVNHPAFQAIIRILQSKEYKDTLTQIMGYDCRRTGEIM